VKFLHTSDWHVGKTLKGRDRLDEQRGVLREIVNVARDHQVDAVLVSGDLYESSSPSAPAQELVVRTLMQLRGDGAEVIAIAGNHDHGATFEAYRPVMRVAGITLVGMARPAEAGGVVRFTARSSGQQAVVAVLPFLSKRYAVRAAQLVANTPAQNVGGYDQMIRDVLANLTAAFTPDSVNLIMSHLTVIGGLHGGGERQAQSIFEYAVPASIFPVEAHYVALGHLHRRQHLPASTPVHYSGSPLAVDFGEQDNTAVVCVVEATSTTPARVTDVPITAGRRLRTVTGTLDELAGLAGGFEDDYLRVVLRETARAGLREQVTQLLPGALEVRIDPDFAASPGPARGGLDRTQGSPQDLFERYCASTAVSDERVAKLFAQLHDEVTGADALG
jgi:DNA repair protein SbcD/Mre11